MPQPLWIADTDSLERLLDRVAQAPAYAIDTEFHREKTYFPHLALVQIASPEEVAVVDPLAVDPAPLRRLLESDALAVLHAAEQDLEVLRLACGAEPRRMFDTQVAAAFLGMGFASLARLVEKVVGRTLPKGDRLTDWTRRPLDEGQVAYAASDVEYLLAIEAALRTRAEESGVLAWVHEECERLRNKPSGPGEPETAWWRIKGSRSLRGKTRGVAQEVAAWRERAAQARDIPPRFVLSDLALAGIVHRPPSTVEQLREVRGLDGRAMRDGTAAAIVAAAQAGAALAPEQLRLPPAGESVDEGRGSRTALALALVAQIADERGIEPTLLANRTDVQLLASGRTTGRLSSGWRGEIVGDALRRLFDGELALTGSKDGGARLVELSPGR
ncbi:HRDC domain-containing protein [bacterium]|nr:HRDC domain-containing protein [bacterium]